MTPTHPNDFVAETTHSTRNNNPVTDPAALLETFASLRADLDALRAREYALRGERIRAAVVQRLATSAEVMAFFCYKSVPAFWNFVHSKGVPHIRLNGRNIKFDPVALNHWLAKRDTSGKPRQFTFGAESNQALPAA